MQLKTVRNCWIVALFALPFLCLLIVLITSTNYGFIQIVLFVMWTSSFYMGYRANKITRIRKHYADDALTSSALVSIVNECADLVGAARPKVVTTKGNVVGICSIGDKSVLFIGENFNVYSLSTDELRSVVLHELGHVKLRTAHIRIISDAIVKSSIWLVLTSLFFNGVSIYGLGSEIYVTILLSVSVVGTVLIQKTWLRIEEYLCDEYAVSKLGSQTKKHLVSALLKFHGALPEWIEANVLAKRKNFFETHPSVTDRAARLGLQFQYSGYGYYTLKI